MTASVRFLAVVLATAVFDYEYLAILERSGRQSQAQKLVVPLAESWFQWNPDTAACAAARSRLAEMILSAKK